MTTIKEIPLLFQTEMVQAILARRKTQTRRTKGLEDVPLQNFDSIEYMPDHWGQRPWVFSHKIQSNPDRFEIKAGVNSLYGKPGDLLYVRENWRLYNYDLEEDELTIEYQSGGSNDFSFGEFGYDYLLEWVAKQQFKLEIKGLVEEDPNNPDRVIFTNPIPWSPSIHLPKILSRIWLMVEEIRVERLQDISEQDAVAEGCSLYGPFGEFRGSVHPNGGTMRYRAYSKASRAFRCIWEEINGVESWKANPWVWVVKFRVLSTTGRPSDDIILQHHKSITVATTADLPSSVSGLPSPITK